MKTMEDIFSFHINKSKTVFIKVLQVKLTVKMFFKVKKKQNMFTGSLLV